MALDGGMYCQRCRREVENEHTVFSSPALDTHFFDRGPPGSAGARVENLTHSCCSPCRQIASLAAQIAQAEATIAAQITQFEAHIAVLKRQMRTVQTERNSVHDQLFLCFPPEVISRIFYYSCGPPPSSGSLATSTQDRAAQHSSSARPQPLVLGAVCKIWRGVAWSTPTLWTEVLVRFRSASRVDSELELMDEWLSLSGRLPITLSIIADKGVFGGTASTPLVFSRRQAIRVITSKYSDRLCSLNIEIRDAVFCHVISQLEIGSSLDELNVHADTRLLCSQPYQAFPPLFRTPSATNFEAPAPRTIRTHAIPPERLNVSWKNAAHVELREVEDRSCTAVLKHATNVVSCKLIGLRHDPTKHPLSPDSIALPHLRSLEYNHSQITPLTPLFSSTILSLPALEDLSFIIGTELPVIKLLSLMERSGHPPLRSLTLARWSDTCEEDLLRLLDGLPNLEELKLHSRVGSYRLRDLLLWQFTGEGEPELASISRGLRPSHHRKHFLPNLRRLEYKGPFKFPWNALTFLLPRQSEPSPSKTDALSSSTSRTPLPATVPPLASSSLEGSHTRRPLRNVRFELLLFQQDEPRIDKDVVLAILEGKRRFGITFDVVGLFGIASSKDLFKASMEHHGIPFPEDDGVGVHVHQEM